MRLSSSRHKPSAGARRRSTRAGRYHREMRRIHRDRTLRPRRVLRVAVLALLLVTLLVPAPTRGPSSSRAAGSPYGHLRITYRNKSTYIWQVNEAFDSWNRAGTPFRFVAVGPGKRADITVTQKAYIGSPNRAVAGVGGVGCVPLGKGAPTAR